MNLEPQTELQKQWRWVHERGDCVVQDFTELEYIHSLMKACKPESYLEIGTAEGDTLLMLGSTLPETGRIHWIDKDEPQFAGKREEVERMLAPRVITHYSGLSTDEGAVLTEQFDVVMIDGGHDYETVYSDCKRFVRLAKKYVFFHDIQLPDVRIAVKEFIFSGRTTACLLPYPKTFFGEHSEFINSETMGYGILRVG